MQSILIFNQGVFRNYFVYNMTLHIDEKTT